MHLTGFLLLFCQVVSLTKNQGTPCYLTTSSSRRQTSLYFILNEAFSHSNTEQRKLSPAYGFQLLQLPWTLISASSAQQDCCAQLRLKLTTLQSGNSAGREPRPAWPSSSREFSLLWAGYFVLPVDQLLKTVVSYMLSLCGCLLWKVSLLSVTGSLVSPPPKHSHLMHVHFLKKRSV